ncbi:hypothetical protein T492DRAFT_833406 [Pavlovales sp. CCMP2436]|nr:hypothetical protein T492DRAFT_833406 [Pavlovales sp. CCMP2436]
MEPGVLSRAEHRLGVMHSVSEKYRDIDLAWGNFTNAALRGHPDSHFRLFAQLVDMGPRSQGGQYFEVADVLRWTHKVEVLAAVNTKLEGTSVKQYINLYCDGSRCKVRDATFERRKAQTDKFKGHMAYALAEREAASEVDWMQTAKLAALKGGEARAKADPTRLAHVRTALSAYVPAVATAVFEKVLPVRARETFNRGTREHELSEPQRWMHAKTREMAKFHRS